VNADEVYAMNADETYYNLKEFNARVKRLIEIRKEREKELHEFALKHNLAYKRPQDFKDCIVIRWRWSRIKYKINYPRLEEYVALCHHLSDKYNLRHEEDPLLDNHLKLYKIGIYCFDSFCKCWAIPNEYKEVQDYVISKLPKWVQISRKN
jgi:hypothetical protein